MGRPVGTAALLGHVRGSLHAAIGILEGATKPLIGCCVPLPQPILPLCGDNPVDNRHGPVDKLAEEMNKFGGKSAPECN